jgi:hypothetical protein
MTGSVPVTFARIVRAFWMVNCPVRVYVPGFNASVAPTRRLLLHC